MDQNPPLKQNRFVLVVVVLFNLIWFALLFLSCQADNKPNPTATPEAGLREHLIWKMAGDFHPESAIEIETRNWVRGVLMRKEPRQPFREMTNLSNYSVPLYNPPSTGSITPVI
jgi:hypothetical protein